MFKYVFVYSPSKFRLDGELKRFARGQMYASVDPMASGGEERVLGRGIYVIGQEDDVIPSLHAIESRPNVDYDEINVAGKDSWPTFVGNDSRLDPEMRGRVRAAFPDVRGEDLAMFTDPRSV